MARGSFSAAVVLRILNPALPKQQPQYSDLGRKEEKLGGSGVFAKAMGLLAKK